MSATNAAASPAVIAQQARIRDLIAQNLYDTKIVGELEENVKFQVGSQPGKQRDARRRRRRICTRRNEQEDGVRWC